MSDADIPAGRTRIGFLGPEGTFTEQALLSQPDLAALDLVALPSIPEVLASVEAGRVDLGFVAVENSIEGAVTVTVDNATSDFATVIEVGASDRLGLLYDITRTFAELGLDVHLAKVATYEGRVVDSFYVRDVTGRKLADDPEEIDRALRVRLEA